MSSQDIPDADLALECLWHPFPPSPPCPSPVTPHGLRGSTHLLHLLLLTIGANALEGLLGVVCISALLLICLLGLGVGVWRGVTWGPQVRLLSPTSLLPVGGCGWVGGLLTRDKDLGIQNGDGEGSLVPRPLPSGDNVALPTAPASSEVWSHQTASRALKMPCVITMPASAHVVELFFSLLSELGDTAQGSLLPLPLESPADSLDDPVDRCPGLAACPSVRSPPRSGRGPICMAPWEQVQHQEPDRPLCLLLDGGLRHPCPRCPVQGSWHPHPDPGHPSRPKTPALTSMAFLWSSSLLFWTRSMMASYCRGREALSLGRGLRTLP